MDSKELLKGKKNCVCGKEHSCEIREVVIESGAMREFAGLCAGFSNILLAADQNTWEVCGRDAAARIEGRIETVKVFAPDGLLIPNEESIAALTALVTDKTDLIVGVGSGVINDLCKYVSFQKGLPYYIVATAPSMDGYASSAAAMTTNNMKTTFKTHVPAVILGDVDVLKNAPMDMLRAGFGDIIGKYSALSDWKLSALLNHEYFCPFIYDLMYDTVLRTRNLASGIETRDPATVKALMEALVVSGIAMAYAGNSRPASGSEHHLSHYFEITGIIKKRPYLSHGLDVAYSTVVTERLRERLLSLEGFPAHGFVWDRAKWEEHIRSSYGLAADGVIALQDSLHLYGGVSDEVYRGNWNEIRNILREVPSSADLLQILESVGLNFSDFVKFYGADVIEDAVLYAKDLKDRYTMLWLYCTVFGQ